MINEINEINKKEIKSLKQLLTSKINLELINYYKQLDYYQDENSEEINDINNKINENINIITNNINILENVQLNINLNDFININISKIYSKIINSLIISNRFKDYNYINDIISQLNLEKIDITKEIFDELNILLNSNMDYINQYKILNVEDIFK